MPITQLTPNEEILRYTEERIARLRRAIFRTLSNIGEQCVNKARSSGNYIDQTGNLRSSIGYVIVEEGEIVKMSDFPPSDKGTDKETGRKEGKEYAYELAKRYPTGIVLILLAGRNYATYVSAKGYDVLDGAELLADQLTDKLLKDLGFK